MTRKIAKLTKLFILGRCAAVRSFAMSSRQGLRPAYHIVVRVPQQNVSGSRYTRHRTFCCGLVARKLTRFKPAANALIRSAAQACVPFVKRRFAVLRSALSLRLRPTAKTPRADEGHTRVRGAATHLLLAQNAAPRARFLRAPLRRRQSPSATMQDPLGLLALAALRASQRHVVPHSTGGDPPSRSRPAAPSLRFPQSLLRAPLRRRQSPSATMQDPLGLLALAALRASQRHVVPHSTGGDPPLALALLLRASVEARSSLASPRRRRAGDE